jgi:hypothetical protein
MARSDLYNTGPQCSSKDNALSRGLDYGLTSRGTVAGFSAGARDFSILQIFQTGAGAEPDSNRIRHSFPGGTAAGF